MIKAIINGIMKLIMSLVSVLTAPIDMIIEQALPDLSNALNSFASVLNLISDVMGWVISLTGISTTAISLIVTYYVFKLTTPILFSSIKAAIKWYKTLKL
ncbi:MAG: hypothetical protein PUB18_04100 [bacterium]|nr:hypothetical protein [bacterium]